MLVVVIFTLVAAKVVTATAEHHPPRRDGWVQPAVTHTVYSVDPHFLTIDVLRVSISTDPEFERRVASHARKALAIATGTELDDSSDTGWDADGISDVFPSINVLVANALTVDLDSRSLLCINLNALNVMIANVASLTVTNIQLNSANVLGCNILTLSANQILVHTGVVPLRSAASNHVWCGAVVCADECVATQSVAVDTTRTYDSDLYRRVMWRCGGDVM